MGLKDLAVDGCKQEVIIMTNWVACPECNNKTRIKIRDDTVLENFPLFCPKCKKETLINIQKHNISVIKEPDAKVQSL